MALKSNAALPLGRHQGRPAWRDNRLGWARFAPGPPNELMDVSVVPHASKRHRVIEAALEQFRAERAATWRARRDRLPPRPAVGVVAIATRRHWRFSNPPVATARPAVCGSP